MIEELRQIIALDGLERKKLTDEFQERVWSDESSPDNPTSEILFEKLNIKRLPA